MSTRATALWGCVDLISIAQYLTLVVHLRKELAALCWDASAIQEIENSCEVKNVEWPGVDHTSGACAFELR